jgi:hypothetical protein
VLAQLRTGMTRLNGYLYRINVADTDQCACGQARETVEHFLFRCQKWTAHRTELLQCTNTHRGNISFFLGGKSPSDDQKWTPNLRGGTGLNSYVSPPPRADSRPPNHANEHKSPPFADLTYQPPRVTDSRRASTAENRRLNTWRIAFKPSY